MKEWPFNTLPAPLVFTSGAGFLVITSAIS